MNRYIRLAFGILISVVALWLILSQVDLSELQGEFARANYWWLLPAALGVLLSNVARARRWQVLLEDKLSLTSLYWITHIGYLLTNVLPFRLGELGRIWLATRSGAVPGMQALSTGILERLLDVLVVVGIMAAILPFVPQQGVVVQASLVFAVVAFVGVAGMFIAAFLRPWVLKVATAVLQRIQPALVGPLVAQLDTFLSAIDTARRGNVLWRSLWWTLLIWVTSPIAAYFTFVGFLSETTVVMAVMATCIVVLGLALPSAPSGLGVFEAAGVAALALFGVAETPALAAVFAFHLLNFVVIAIVGVIGLDAEKVSFSEVAQSAQGVMKSLRSDSSEANVA